jgi:REP element-mobilizing transposase RayT
MPQTLSFNLVHVVFSTKDRVPLIREELSPGLHAYLAGTARGLDCECLRVGGMEDHVHLALRLAATRAAARVVSEIKTASCVWMKGQGVREFAWQRGYGLFSVSPAHLGALIQYIDGQREHHRKRGFQEEMRGLLERYHVEFDERYVWG